MQIIVATPGRLLDLINRGVGAEAQLLQLNADAAYFPQRICLQPAGRRPRVRLARLPAVQRRLRSLRHRLDTAYNSVPDKAQKDARA